MPVKFLHFQNACHYFSSHSALNENSTISLKIGCSSNTVNATIDVGLVVRASPCFEEYIGFEVSLPDFLRWYYYCPTTIRADYGYESVRYLQTRQFTFSCSHHISLDAIGSDFFKSDVSNQCKPEMNEVCFSSSGDLNEFYKTPNLPKQNLVCEIFSFSILFIIFLFFP